MSSSGYGKVFVEIFDSTLMAEGGMDAVYLFMCLITLSDREGILNIAEPVLMRKIDMTPERYAAALEVLMAEDEHSNITDFGGRRVRRACDVDFIPGNRGLYVVNKDHYRQKSSAEDRREQNRLAQQRLRDKRKLIQEDSKQPVSSSKQPVSSSKQESYGSAHTDTDTDTDTSKEKKPTNSSRLLASMFLQFWAVWPKGLKVGKQQTIKEFNKVNPDGAMLKLMIDAIGKQQTIRTKKAARNEFVAALPHPERWIKHRRWEDDLGELERTGKFSDQDYGKSGALE